MSAVGPVYPITWAIIPVKPLRLGKSRLSGILSQDARAELNRRMLQHTLEVLTSMPEISRVLVVSRDAKVLSLARQAGATTVQEFGPQTYLPTLESASLKDQSHSLLNRSLAQAARIALDFNARSVLVVPADLPQLQRTDIQAMLSLDRDPPLVVIAPDRTCQGTNALLLDPPNTIPFEFGPGSYERHCQLAALANARCVTVENPALALDLDTPEDLSLVLEQANPWVADIAQPKNQLGAQQGDQLGAQPGANSGPVQPNVYGKTDPSN